MAVENAKPTGLNDQWWPCWVCVKVNDFRPGKHMLSDAVAARQQV
jgi:hypothetical protein